MSLPHPTRRAFAFGLLAVLPACGFTPVYGVNGAGTALQGAVRADDPVTREGFLLVRELEARLGRADPGQYGLSYSVGIESESVAISATNVTTRYNLLGAVTYALRDLNTQAVITSGKVSNFTGYSASGSTVATQAAERDARERLMTMLTDQIITRLIVAAPRSGL
ncbi:LPS assembly lipoprotein LptE [Roseovarius nanhaiticus]|uniref:LPS assembly lipoprotein LptE n=1 Tax=Roseovarius nanhaiticus TaxID=573024 RepID=UPI002492EB39|nr:LPS assembly lipoprotein LptE [Roseovarius nanhaiticus]